VEREGGGAGRTDLLPLVIDIVVHVCSRRATDQDINTAADRASMSHH
jgi:hypothetical protein